MTIELKDPADTVAPQPIDLHPVQNYTFLNTSVQPEEDSSVAERMRRLQDQYDETGMRRSVDAVIVCHDHGVPCIFTFQIANDFFKLPGGYLDPSEDDVEGISRLLEEFLGTGSKQWRSDQPNWTVRSLLAVWYRPNFDGFFPAHVSMPKECRKIFLVTMAPEQMLGVPLNMKLLAIPIHEFYDNTQRYGPQLSAIPHLLSRRGQCGDKGTSTVASTVRPIVPAYAVDQVVRGPSRRA
ncbi:hypothetical protein A1Q2_03829 [Trichosporon asahii var. asahii CBS 8904]|uniref:Cleavage and polyadenylation specificity factor subunit 5 n=1 Tax=Trichosporon asahii var. asahii (strain CBS 8904) TaxID=1220162 RepID=K1VM05_TRIAC|nr:hypothetical protein A1Q2_03829 [Trichosporon asahii var. asahii CBS 8904]